MEAGYTDLVSIPRLAKGKMGPSGILIIASESTGMCSIFSHNRYWSRRWFKNCYSQTGRDLFTP